MDKLIDIKRIKKLKRIGKGGFSSVYKVRETTTGKILAAKLVYNYNDFDDLSEFSIFQNEIKITSYFSHPTILEYCGYSPIDFCNENNPIIFLQYIPHGSLYSIIELEKSHQSPHLKEILMN